MKVKSRAPRWSVPGGRSLRRALPRRWRRRLRREVTRPTGTNNSVTEVLPVRLPEVGCRSYLGARFRSTSLGKGDGKIAHPNSPPRGEHLHAIISCADTFEDPSTFQLTDQLTSVSTSGRYSYFLSSLKSGVLFFSEICVRVTFVINI